MYWVQLFNILSRKIKVLFWCRRPDQFAHKSMSNANRFCPKANTTRKHFTETHSIRILEKSKNHQSINLPSNYRIAQHTVHGRYFGRTSPVKIDARQIRFELSIFSSMTVNRLTRMSTYYNSLKNIQQVWRGKKAMLPSCTLTHESLRKFVCVCVLRVYGAYIL